MTALIGTNGAGKSTL
ncbi:MAG: hypothetical protein ACLRZ2_02290 [Veillonella sp.]